tara:strand:- start:762 stop:944 length:183 start_codon:yes stop_codon:yes gene_type:complete
MNNLKRETGNKTIFVKDPFHEIINDIFDEFNFNVKIPSGERNYMKQPKSNNKVKQDIEKI